MLGKMHCVMFHLSTSVETRARVVLSRVSMLTPREEHLSVLRCCYKMHLRQIPHRSATRLLLSSSLLFLLDQQESGA